MALYHKYRPDSFEKIIGNEDAITALQSTLKKDDKPHAFLIHGETGCGKTTLGRIIAKELDCKGLDFREVDSADFRGIDTIRDIRKQSVFKPLESPCRVWLLDECHKLSVDAMNALLKALEDPPPTVYYILCTTDPQKLLTTIRGRCSQYKVNPLKDKQTFRLLRKVVSGENEKLQKVVYEQIIQDSSGHPRNALQILDQVLAVEPDKRLKVATQQAELQSQTIELCRALMSKSPWSKIKNILSGLKDNENPETIRRQILGYCSAILLKSMNFQAAMIMEEFEEPLYDIGWPGVVLNCYRIICSEE
jgi:DNA polymerase-3 subunit gamma/tau